MAGDGPPHSGEDYRRIFLDLPDLYYRIARSGRIEMVSPASMFQLGYPPEALIGRDITELYADPDRPPHLVSRRDEPGRSLMELELALRHADGAVVWMSSFAHVRTGPDGHGSALEGIAHNITRQKVIEGELRERGRELDDAQRIGNIGHWRFYRAEQRLVWSPEVYRIFGIDPDAGHPGLAWVQGRVHPDDSARVEAARAEALARDEPYSYECRIVRPSGELRYIRVHARAERDERGAIVSYFGTSQDVTEQALARRAQVESEEVMRAFVENSPSAILITELGGRVKLANEQFANRFAMRRDDVLGRDIREVFDDEFALEAILAGHELAARRGAAEQEIRIRRRDGVRIDVLVTSFPLRGREEGITEIGTFITDITERKAAEHELARHRERLEELVAERTRELSETQSDLLRSERLAAIGQLTATVSHELRNPLGTIRTSFTVLTETTRLVDARSRRVAARIDRNIDRCVRIIEELLDYTRSRPLSVARVPLDEWCREVVSDMSVPDRCALEVRCESGAYAMIDEQRLAQALVNLVQNACQACVEDDDRETPALVTVETAARNGVAEFRVVDNGPGVPDDVLPQIFEPLFSTRGFGIGLGLPLVKRVVEEHGGTVSIETVPGAGTTVTVTLPRDG